MKKAYWILGEFALGIFILALISSIFYGLDVRLTVTLTGSAFACGAIFTRLYFNSEIERGKKEDIGKCN